MPHSSCLNSPRATVSAEPTVVVTDLAKQHEELLALEQLHDQMDDTVAWVHDKFVDAHDVVMLQFGHMLELGLHVHDHFVVACLDDLDGELPVGRQLPTALDQSHGALAQVFQLLETVLEAFETHPGAVFGEHLDLVVFRHEEEDVAVGADPRLRKA